MNEAHYASQINAMRPVREVRMPAALALRYSIILREGFGDMLHGKELATINRDNVRQDQMSKEI